MEFLFFASMEKKKSEGKSICHPPSFPILLFFLQESSKNKYRPISPKNQGFINYAFCRNWAVRNPAGNRLDSYSLVNKQVALSLGTYQLVRRSTFLEDPKAFFLASRFHFNFLKHGPKNLARFCLFLVESLSTDRAIARPISFKNLSIPVLIARKYSLESQFSQIQGFSRLSR